jgi:hypothetical protein
MAEKEWTLTELVPVFRKGAEHLENMARQMDFPWDPLLTDPMKLHNMYARNLITSYVSRFAELAHGVLHGIEQSNCLMYAVCRRALLENTAMLRYYVVEKYKPLLDKCADKGTLSVDEMRCLIEIDDQHLRGGKFDWESFMFKNYSKMKADVVTKLASKGKKPAKSPDAEAGPAQVRIGLCFESWAIELPEVMVVYNLFCDLVHPNVGSSFLVASASDTGMYFSRYRGDSIGRAIMEQSFPILVSVTQKPFGQYLLGLMGSIWHDDELSTEPRYAEKGDVSNC